MSVISVGNATFLSHKDNKHQTALLKTDHNRQNETFLSNANLLAYREANLK